MSSYFDPDPSIIEHTYGVLIMATNLTEVAGSHTNGTMGDEKSVIRDVKNHMLFEVSTEAANRGNIPSFPNIIIIIIIITNILASGRDLLGDQVQSSSYDCGIWRSIYSYWPSQSRLSKPCKLV